MGSSTNASIVSCLTCVSSFFGLEAYLLVMQKKGFLHRVSHCSLPEETTSYDMLFVAWKVLLCLF